MAGVRTNLKDGILFAANTTYSHKTSLLLLTYANPMVLGILASIAIPAFISYQDRVEEAALIEAEQIRELEQREAQQN